MGGECKGGERRGGEGSSRPVRGGMAVFGLPGSQFTSALFLSDMVQISCLSKAEVTGHFTAPNRNWARAKGTGEDQKLISLSQRSETQTRQPGSPAPVLCAATIRVSTLLICPSRGQCPPTSACPDPRLRQLYQELQPTSKQTNKRQSGSSRNSKTKMLSGGPCHPLKVLTPEPGGR